MPGIAGLILTVAMAVDSNVLIYERVREEARLGPQRSLSLDQGFERALATIIDANLTTLLAAAILFFLGPDRCAALPSRCRSASSPPSSRPSP